MKQHLMFFYLLLLALLFTQCSPSYVFEKEYDIANASWTYADTLDFDIHIEDTTALYNLYLDIEHAFNYSFQNIYIQIRTSYPSGKQLKELLPIDFADKTGKWYGKCNSEWCQLRVNIQQKAFFNKKGKYVITLEQYMRKQELKGIKKIAFRMEEVVPSR